jgi:hypothetical protein
MIESSKVGHHVSRLAAHILDGVILKNVATNESIVDLISAGR